MKDCMKRMQDNLRTLRKSMGWSSTELGERVGLSRQFISMLENHRYTMTKTQYLAICKVVEDEIHDEIEWTSDEHELYLTQILLECFIKDDEGWFDSEEDQNKTKRLIEIYSEAAFNKRKSRDDVHKEFKQAMKDIGIDYLI